MGEKNKGLYEKFEVKRIEDPTDKHKYCTYFVLDTVHDKYSSVALEAYAKACEEEYPELAKDLRRIQECTQPGLCECPGLERCPSCCYTEHDKKYLMDHHYCRLDKDFNSERQSD